MDPLLTTAEAAALLRMREGTLREHTRRGLVPHVRLGRLIRYDAADLRIWLATIKTPAQLPV
jgi:excisionase family DNA binding protein